MVLLVRHSLAAKVGVGRLSSGSSHGQPSACQTSAQPSLLLEDFLLCSFNKTWGGWQVREQQGQGPNAGRWFCFDDSSVEPWDIANLERDCFGGKQAADYGNFGDTAGPVQARRRRF